MNSKSVLILGIVFIFLLNVVAVHNYIDKYYYKPVKKNEKKADTPLSDLLSHLIQEDKEEKIEVIEPEQNTSAKKMEEIAQKLIQKEKEKIIKKIKTKKEKEIDKKTVQKKVLKEDKNLTKKENITIYKGNFFNQAKKEENELEELKKLENMQKKTQDLKTSEQNTTVKKEDTHEDKKEKDAFIVLNLDVNNPYDPKNPIIRKIAKQMNNKRVIKIKIYKYSIKIKDYIEKIKSNFVDYGIDIDDIKVSYNKNEDKKNKIKILLTKKD